MKPFASAAAVGLVALLTATPALAWAELNFVILTQSPQQSIVLQCDANYAAPCRGAGISSSNPAIPYNPLDGNRWSHYRLLMHGQTVQFDMHDNRVGCSVGSGWLRGWSWNLYATGPDGRTLGPYEICTSNNPNNGKETLRMAVSYYPWKNLYDIDLHRDGPWRNPLDFEFNPRDGRLSKKAALIPLSAR